MRDDLDVAGGGAAARVAAARAVADADLADLISIVSELAPRGSTRATTTKFADDDADEADAKMLLATLLSAAATRPDCEHTRCVLYGDVSWRGELLQEITTTIAVHQLHPRSLPTARRRRAT